MQRDVFESGEAHWSREERTDDRTPQSADFVFPWLLALAAPIAIVWHFLSAVATCQSSYAGVMSMILCFWSAIGVLIALFVLLGTAFRWPLARRAAVVLTPIGGALLVLLYLAVAGEVGDKAAPGGATLAVVAIAVLAPILCSLRSAKRFFGLVCPECGGSSLSSDTLTMTRFSCRQCRTILRRCQGSLIPVAGSSPQRGGPADVAAKPLQTARPLPRDAFAYARQAGPGYAGPVGEQRNGRTVLIWAAASFVVYVATIILAIAASAVARRGASAFAVFFLPQLLMGVLTLIAGVLWLVWVWRIHVELRDFTGWEYPVSPGRALGFSFIPLFNLGWIPYVLYKASQFAADGVRPRRPAASDSAVLVLAILSSVLGGCGGSIGLVLLGVATLLVQKGLNQLWTRAMLVAEEKSARTAPLQA